MGQLDMQDRFEASRRGSSGELGEGPWVDDRLAAAAAAVHRARQRRAQHFNPALFSEPAWDMLLELFVNRTRGLRVATTHLCAASGTPLATCVRWIGTLEAQGLLRRYRVPEDRRLTLIELTASAYDAMRGYIAQEVLRQHSTEAIEERLMFPDRRS